LRNPWRAARPGCSLSTRLSTARFSKSFQGTSFGHARPRWPNGRCFRRIAKELSADSAGPNHPTTKPLAPMHTTRRRRHVPGPQTASPRSASVLLTSSGTGPAGQSLPGRNYPVVLRIIARQQRRGRTRSIDRLR
jgi:hypothetical protein